MHEIISIQCGDSANWIATHFWNAQEHYFSGPNTPLDADVLFRTGEGPGGAREYSPRALVYDLKNAFGSMRFDNVQLQPEDEAAYDVLREETVLPNAYQEALARGELTQLESKDVRYWSDYKRFYYHARSCRAFNDYTHRSPLVSFDRFQQGADMYSRYREEILEQELRRQAEECDRIQGMRVLSSLDDGWSGFSSALLADMRDEYSKTELWTMLTETCDNQEAAADSTAIKTLNFANSVTQSIEHSDLMIPLCIPETYPSYLQKDSDMWHKSSLVSTALESLLFPFHLQDGLDMSSVSQDFSDFSSRKIGKLQLSFPGYAQDLINLSWARDAGHMFNKFTVLRALNPDAFKLSASFQSKTRFPILETLAPIFRDPEPEVSTYVELSADASLRKKIGLVTKEISRVYRGEDRSILIEALKSAYEQWSGAWESDGLDEDD